MNNTFYLECSDQKHHKFYEVTLSFPIVLVTYGRIGRNGRNTFKYFPTSTDALHFFHRQIKYKLKRGYKKAVRGSTEPRGRLTYLQQLRIPFL